jgi:hypothetical protein
MWFRLLLGMIAWSATARQMNGRSSQQCPISASPSFGRATWAAKHIELVPQQQLDVLDVQPATAPNKRSKQSARR